MTGFCLASHDCVSVPLHARSMDPRGGYSPPIPRSDEGCAGRRRRDTGGGMMIIMLMTMIVVARGLTMMKKSVRPDDDEDDPFRHHDDVDEDGLLRLLIPLEDHVLGRSRTRHAVARVELHLIEDLITERAGDLSK